MCQSLHAWSRLISHDTLQKAPLDVLIICTRIIAYTMYIIHFYTYLASFIFTLYVMIRLILMLDRRQQVNFPKKKNTNANGKYYFPQLREKCGEMWENVGGGKLLLVNLLTPYLLK